MSKEYRLPELPGFDLEQYEAETIKQGIADLETIRLVVFSILSLFLVVSVIGYALNFQNLFEYWPDSGKIGDCGIAFVLSAIGVFVPPLGAFMGIFF